MDFIHVTLFSGQKDRHGAVKRSDQIHELIDNYINYSINPNCSLKESFKNILRFPIIATRILPRSIYLFLFRGVKLRASIVFFIRYISFFNFVHNNKKNTFLFEGGNAMSILLLDYLRSIGINYYVFTHNIEFLVNQIEDSVFKSNSKKYELEINSYKFAKGIFTISDFDKALLSCAGINSIVLPYFPCKKDEKFLNDIYVKRSKNNNKNIILLLGTIVNNPTRMGLINVLKKINIKSDKYKIIVAGYGTEDLNKFASEKIKILGSISDEKLKRIMIKSKILLINQPQTTGFLTKLVEFNLAGIPVLVLSDYIQSLNLERFGIFRISFDKLESTIIKNFKIYNFKKFKKPTIRNIKIPSLYE